MRGALVEVMGRSHLPMLMELTVRAVDDRPVQRNRVPPHAYFVGSAVFHYLGPACAVLLFARIDVLGVASAKRLPVMPDVPTLKELGVQGLEAENLFALMAPKGTPKDRLDIVAGALAKAQGDAGFRKAIEAQGFQISEIPAKTLPQFILDQQAFWRDKVKALNITASK